MIYVDHDFCFIIFFLLALLQANWERKGKREKKENTLAK